MGMFKDFTVEGGLIIPEEYKSRPEGHEKAVWTHLDGTTTRYVEIEDIHLMNILHLVRRSKSCYQQMVNMGSTSKEVIDQLKYFKIQDAYASHEVYRRGLYVNKKEEYTEIKES